MALLTMFEKRCLAWTSSSALSTAGEPPRDRLQAGCQGGAVVVTPARALQVQNISLAEGETLTVESVGGPEPTLLANESFLLRGQVIRSPANLLTLRFQSPRPPSPGSYHFHYQGTGQRPPLAQTPGTPPGAPPLHGTNLGHGDAPWRLSVPLAASAGTNWAKNANGELIGVSNYGLI